jgi:CDP-diacylglycerol--glycerol-3-phosphate 3-phosphatidyltransferase
MSPEVRRNLPNALTLLRLILAAAFFAAISGWQYRPHDIDPLWADIAIVLFILAAATDAFDGYLARRWNVMSLFGRIMDPVCDKVLVLGAFVFLAGPRFVMPEKVEAGDLFTMASGIYPWMAVLIIFRELVVTGVRSVAEAMGVSFGSNWWGKAKMILQTIAIPVAILVAANFDHGNPRSMWAIIARDILVWGTLAVTLISGLPYVTDFARIIRGGESGAASSGGDRAS